MDPMTRILIRLAMWFRHPPSPQRVKLIVAVIVLSVALVAIERWFGWPDWLTTERVPIRRM